MAQRIAATAAPSERQLDAGRTVVARPIFPVDAALHTLGPVLRVVDAAGGGDLTQAYGGDETG